MTSLYLLYAVHAGAVVWVGLVVVDLVELEEVVTLGYLVLPVMVWPYPI